MIKTALFTACAVLALQVGLARLQASSQLWRAPAATCEGLPPINVVPVPMPPKGSNT